MGHGFIMGLGDGTAGRKIFRPPQSGKDIIADDGKAFTLPGDAALHRIYNEGAGLLHSGDGGDAVMEELREDGLLVNGAAPVALHHPQVGIGDVDKGKSFKDESPVDAVHGQNNGKEQADAHHGGQKPPQMLLDIPNRQVHRLISRRRFWF